MSLVRHWIQAARPLAQANIAVPLLVGQAAAYGIHGVFSWKFCAALAAWGLLDQWFIVFANDFADHHTDSTETTLFSGGSGVIAQGALTAPSIARAAAISAAGLALCSTGLTFANRPFVLVAFVLAIGLVWAYSYAPLYFAKHPSGALLQGIGVGIVLPALGYYVQSGHIDVGAIFELLSAGFLLGTAGNLTTALPDIDVDRLGKKTTFAVRFGAQITKALAALLITMALWLAKPEAIVLAVFGVLLAGVVLIPDGSRQSLRSTFLLSIALVIVWLVWALEYLA